MSEMVERVARVLNPFVFETISSPEYSNSRHPHRVYLEAQAADVRKKARAIIEAMREPTMEMVKAAETQAGRPYTYVYRDMIDAALKA